MITLRKIYHLRRIAALLIVFGLGLLVGGNIGPLIQNIYIAAFIIWLLYYDLALEDREEKNKNKDPLRRPSK
ncbi:hypothetical protein [Enterococcus faecalis]|uniref:hypothetical protein n=1 Tax=Enterococcus faecalis TaxID=1351 RepID=UPI001AD75751|nr:hypothetical protein [Enterococcus faecalis]MBO6461984.1 hypothetical protein [Enterococcus faecalis]